MSTHNAGKINWNIIFDNVNYNKHANKFEVKNVKALEFLSKQIFNLIVEFSNTPQKKPSSNMLFQKYPDPQLNPINWENIAIPITNLESNTELTEEEKESWRQYWIELYLRKGASLACEGYIGMLAKAYIHLNLVLADWDYIWMCGLDDFHFESEHDNGFPKFFRNEFKSMYNRYIKLDIS